MKEHHLDEALSIRTIINHLVKCRQIVEAGKWTIRSATIIGAPSTESDLASNILGGVEEDMQLTARNALLATLARETAANKKRLQELGVELTPEPDKE